MPSVSPLSALSPEALIQYLGARGTPRSIVEWKYFDDSIAGSTERGFALVEDREIVGFLGLIPMEMRNGNRRLQMAWTCDWSVDNRLRGAYGLFLLKTAVEHAGQVIALGGADTTRQILARLARSRDDQAGIVFRKHLALGAYARALQRRKFPVANEAINVLDRIALPRLRKARVETKAFRALTSDRLVPPETDTGGNWTPSYDSAALEWRLLRCPVVEAWVCEGPQDRASVLVWRSTEQRREWKAALFGTGKETGELSACLESALRHIVQQGGSSVSVLVSRWDRTLIGVLSAARFREAKFNYPIYFLQAGTAGESLNTIAGLSYLDSDLHYRF